MKFRVTYEEVHSIDIDVDAESEQEARVKVEDMIAEGFLDWPEHEPIYDYTIPREKWPVKKVDLGK